MDIPSTKVRSPRTARTRSTRAKAAEMLKKVPTALLLKKKAECDAKALKIVEQMIEPEVDVDWMLDSLSHINKAHMDDIVEERSISKLCGYPLCDNPLKKVVNKQYQISTLRNKVYDITKVKNFCSFRCYTATEYLLEQMLTSPLWHREQEEIPKFQILPKCKSRCVSPPGVEVNLAGIQLPEDNDEEEVPAEKPKNRESQDEDKSTSKETKPLEESTSQETQNFEKNTENETRTLASNQNSETETVDEKIKKENHNEVETRNKMLEVEFQTTTTPQEKTNFTDTQNKAQNTETHINESVIKPPRETKKTERRKLRESKKPISFETLTSRVEKSCAEWITEETICLLRGDDLEKQKILENVRNQEKYAVLCKKLNHLQLEEEREGIDRIGELKPAPEFAALQEEAQRLELKVRAFYEGSTIISRIDAKPEESAKQEEKEPEVVLPMIDNHAPKALRRRIFLDKLNKVLPDLLRALGGRGQTSSQYSYTSERCATVRALVTTFSLSAGNIVFKTPEWTLVALIIIKLLAFMDPRMKHLLASKQASLYTSMILLSYKLDPNYLERIVISLITPAKTIDEKETQDS